MYFIAPQFFKKVLCLSGFGWLVRGAVVNFFEHKTSVAVHYERRFDHTLPNIAFCRREAFAGGTTWTDMVWLWCLLLLLLLLPYLLLLPPLSHFSSCGCVFILFFSSAAKVVLCLQLVVVVADAVISVAGPM